MVNARSNAAEAVGLTLQASGAVKAATVSLGALALSQRRLDALARKAGGVNSVLVAAFPYYAGPRDLPMSLYAQGLDYVPVLTARMERAVEALARRWPSAFFAALPEGSPLPIVEVAYRAGLALKGKNGLAIVPPYGSLIFLSALVSDMDWSALLPPSTVCSDSCRACLSACPTGALLSDGLDRGRCLSYISQRWQATPEQLALLEKDPTLWGCDRCQLCCPHNHAPALSPYPEFTASLLPPVIDADALVGRACNKHGLALLQRNAELGGFHHIKGDS